MNRERNGKGKEYSHGQILFEGNNINGVRYGNGQEYSNGNLIIRRQIYK